MPNLKLPANLSLTSFLPASVSSQLDNLSDKDRRALMLLLVFLCGALLYGVYALHAYASKLEKSAMQAQNDLFWLRSQAPLLAQRAEVNSSELDTIVNQAASRYGISASIAQSGERAQLSAQHADAAILGNFFAGLASEGLLFERLTMTQQADQSILAEATVVKRS